MQGSDNLNNCRMPRFEARTMIFLGVAILRHESYLRYYGRVPMWHVRSARHPLHHEYPVLNEVVETR